MPKKISALVASVIAITMFAVYLFKSDGKDKTIQAVEVKNAEYSQITLPKPVAASNEISTEKQKKKKHIFRTKYTDAIDMDAWQYNKENGVYYQLGVLYVPNPADENYERLALFVPEKFLTCSLNKTKKYTCVLHKLGEVGPYTVATAPIVIPIESKDYAANPPLTEYRDFSVHTKKGHIYVHVGFRGIEYGAPAGLVDIKAAIRYIRRNKEKIPANTDRIFVSGMGSAGNLGSLIGVSADSVLFKPYLKALGASDYVSDQVHGVMVWNPITGLDVANEAYEWNMGLTRENMSEQQQKLSQKMAYEYAKFVNRAGFRDEYGKPLMLQYSNRGTYWEGTYYHYVKQIIEKSLNEFLISSTYPLSIDGKNLPAFLTEYSGYFIDQQRYLRRLNKKFNWIKYDNSTDKYVIGSMEDFVRIMKPATKSIGAFDSPKRDNTENLLFGTGDGNGKHFDQLMPKVLKNSPEAKKYTDDWFKPDAFGSSVQDRLNMYTPLYFVLPSYEGYNTTKVAPFWRVRSGISQTETALVTEINLALALVNYPAVKKVDFKAIWGQSHVKAEEKQQESEAAFSNWIDKVLYERR